MPRPNAHLQRGARPPASPAAATRCPRLVCAAPPRPALSDESGAAILEFALVLPVLLILLMGVFEVGRALYISLAVEIAVQGGARALARVADPTCLGSCSPAVEHALRRVSDQIVAQTGVRRETVRLIVVPDGPPGTISLRGEVGISLRLFGAANGPNVWNVAVVRQEQRLAN